MRNALLAALSVLAFQAGCSCIIDTENEQGQPCLNGLCLAGYVCNAEEICVSPSSGRDAGSVPAWPDAGTAPIGWQAPEPLGHPWSGSPLSDSAPTLAIADNGDVFLAFADNQGAINVRRRVKGTGAWDPLFAIATSGGSTPLIAAGPAGTAVVAWGEGYFVYASYFQPGSGWPGGWQSPQYAASGAPGDTVTLSSIDMGSNGVALLYRLGRPDGTVDLSLTASAAGTWHQAGIATYQPGATEGALAISVDAPDLKVAIAYSNGPAVTGSLNTFTTYSPNILYDGARVISPDFGPWAQTGAPEVAADGNGNGMALYRFTGSTSGLYATRLFANQWDSPVRVDLGTGAPGAASAAVDGDGNGLALYRDCPTDCAIWATGYVGQGGFLAPAQVSAMAPEVDEPRVALDGAGRALQVWLQGSPAGWKVWASETSELRSPIPFGPAREISSSGAGFVASSPVLAYRAGVGYAAWVLTQGTYQTLEGALFRASPRP